MYGLKNMFSKEDRSSFPYWFAHWCAFNMVALVCKRWKFKYLFHDIEKPWLKLFMPYEKVQKFHRLHSRHHLEYPGERDWEAMVIDWECSRYTKQASPRTAKEELERLLDERKIVGPDYVKAWNAIKILGLDK